MNIDFKKFWIKVVNENAWPQVLASLNMDGVPSVPVTGPTATTRYPIIDPYAFGEDLAGKLARAKRESPFSITKTSTGAGGTECDLTPGDWGNNTTGSSASTGIGGQKASTGFLFGRVNPEGTPVPALLISFGAGATGGTTAQMPALQFSASGALAEGDQLQIQNVATASFRLLQGASSDLLLFPGLASGWGQPMVNSWWVRNAFDDGTPANIVVPRQQIVVQHAVTVPSGFTVTYTPVMRGHPFLNGILEAYYANLAYNRRAALVADTARGVNKNRLVAAIPGYKDTGPAY